MEETVQILKILKHTYTSLKKGDYVRIKSLSDKLIENSSVHRDPDIISVAVIIYSLSKLIERDQYRKEKNWNRFYSDYRKNIKDMIIRLEKNDINGFRKEVNANRKLIQSLTGRLKMYISDVFKKARINKASEIYGQGISMEKTAKILGVSLWELAEYTGQRSNDYNLSITMPIKERVKIAKEVFG